MMPELQFACEASSAARPSSERSSLGRERNEGFGVEANCWGIELKFLYWVNHLLGAMAVVLRLISRTGSTRGVAVPPASAHDSKSVASCPISSRGTRMLVSGEFSISSYHDATDSSRETSIPSAAATSSTSMAYR